MARRRPRFRDRRGSAAADRRAEQPRVRFEPVVHRVADRRRRGRHGAHDVAAGRQCRQQRGVDLGHRRLEPGFDDAVKLDALPGRDPQRAVGITVGDLVEGEILLRGQPPAGMRTRTMNCQSLSSPRCLRSVALSRS